MAVIFFAANSGKQIFRNFVRKVLTLCEQVFIIHIEQKFRTDFRTEGTVQAMTRRRHHYRIVNPVRFFIFILITVMVLIFAAYSILNIGQAEAAAVNTYAQVSVSENESLWSIAERYNSSVDVDTREIIHEICEINDISAADVNAGDTIFVPVYQ
jgi:hypothetical protein